MEDKEIINEIKQDFKTHEEKYKQIEEMAKVIEVCLKIHFGAGDIVEPEDFPYQAKDIAQEIVNKGWIKPAKDSVALSREEYAELKHTKILLKELQKDKKFYQNAVLNNLKKIEKLENQLKQASKETVEKLIAKIKQFLSNVETVLEGDKYSLYPEIGYKCSEVDSFIDDLANNSMLVED